MRTIRVEHLGTTATEADVERMVQLLRVRGYETEHGMINGAVEPSEIPQDVWDDCLSIVGADE